jgi:cytidylate kinase
MSPPPHAPQRHPPLAVTIPPAASHPSARITNQAPPVFRLDQPIIITIDGPAGTGKSSVARQLAKRLGLDFLDTGAMYRAAAAIALDHGIGLDQPDRLVAKVIEADLHFDWSQDPPAMLAFGRSINSRIRDLDVTAIVSPVAAIAALREHMVRKQRIIAAQHPRLVTEGRDQGSVVFPDAIVQFYLTASVQERARRRAQQLAASGSEPDTASLEREIDARDRSDMGRAVGPLRRPDKATVLDTSDLSFDQVVDELERIVRRRAAEP